MQAANALYVPAAEFGSQRIAIDTKQICRTELVAVGGSKACAQQGWLYFRKDAFIEASGRQVGTERGEVFGEIVFEEFGRLVEINRLIA